MIPNRLQRREIHAMLAPIVRRMRAATDLLFECSDALEEVMYKLVLQEQVDKQLGLLDEDSHDELDDEGQAGSPA